MEFLYRNGNSLLDGFICPTKRFSLEIISHKDQLLHSQKKKKKLLNSSPPASTILCETSHIRVSFTIKYVKSWKMPETPPARQLLSSFPLPIQASVPPWQRKDKRLYKCRGVQVLMLSLNITGSTPYAWFFFLLVGGQTHEEPCLASGVVPH